MKIKEIVDMELKNTGGIILLKEGIFFRAKQGLRVFRSAVVLFCVLFFTSQAHALTYTGGSADGYATQEGANVDVVTIESAANQTFEYGDGATAISTITVTQIVGQAGAGINTTDDIRIIIPSGLGMVWDSSDTTATIGGAASANVSTTVSYEDSDKTLVVNVTTGFSNGDVITVSGLSFKTFDNVSSDSLELEIDNAGTTIATDSFLKTINLPDAAATFTGGSADGYATVSYSGFQVDGTLYESDETTPETDSAMTVVIKVNGVDVCGGACTDETNAADGTWSVAGIFVNAGDTITVYLDGEAEQANVVTITDGSTDITGVNLIQDHVIIRADNGATAITILDLVDYDNDDDSADLLFTATDASPDTLSVEDGNELIINTGDTFTPGGNVTGDDIKITGIFTAGTFSHTVSGSFVSSGTFTPDTSMVTFDAPGATTETITMGGDAFYDIVFNDGGGGATFDLQDAFDADNDFTITGGTLTANGQTMTIGGNWSNSDTFTHENNTVDFDDDTQGNTISGANTFYNLTVSTATAKTVTFASGVTQTVSNNLTLTGASGQLLTLAPGTASTDWGLTWSAGGTQSIDYVSVSYSDASGGTTIDADNGNSTDGGGNTNWDFLSSTTTLYRSVGTTATDLNTGTETVTISGSTATFSGAMSNDIGVGDALTYSSGGSNRLAFIHGRTSSTVFTVKEKGGNVPAAAAAATAVSVYRAYTSLANWESQTENANITEPTEDDVNPNLDLTDATGANTVMQVAAYADGADTTAVSISGWTTDSDNYIRIFTPTETSEVGTSQRHSGVWNTGAYYMDVSTTAITLDTSFIRLEGLQIEMDGANSNSAIYTNIASNPDIQISENIIREATADTNTSNYGIRSADAFTGGTIKIWNNIIYGFNDSSDRCITYFDNNVNVYAYNNTIYGCTTGINVSGFSPDFHAKNNIVNNSTTDYNGTFRSTSTNNISEDDTAPGTNGRTCTVSFVDAAGGDFSLNSSDTCAIDSGADLSGDGNIAITDDITGASRSDPYEAGAFEVADRDTRTFYRSVGTDATELLDDGGSTTVTIGDGTATFSAAVPDSVGVGDTLAYTDENGDNALAFITARTSSTVFSVKDKLGSEPNYADANAVDVYRAYTSFDNWASQTENANITEPTENDVNPSQDLTSADYIYYTPFYADGADGSGELDLSSFTTSSSNYIQMYTPISTSEVGASQRHEGVWSTSKARVEITNEDFIQSMNSYTRVIGLQIQYTGTDTTSETAIKLGNSLELTISYNIVKGVLSGSAANKVGIGDGFYRSPASASGHKIYNNIVYDFINGAESTVHAFMFHGNSNLTAYIYNNTAVNSYNCYTESSAADILAKNNIAMDCSTDYNGLGNASSTNNQGEDGTAPDTNEQTCSVTFADEAGDDFRLGSDSCANEKGTDLSGDGNLAFNDDIEGESRPQGTLWDIGADDTSNSASLRRIIFTQ